MRRMNFRILLFAVAFAVGYGAFYLWLDYNTPKVADEAIENTFQNVHFTSIEEIRKLEQSVFIWINLNENGAVTMYECCNIPPIPTHKKRTDENSAMMPDQYERFITKNFQSIAPLGVSLRKVLNNINDEAQKTVFISYSASSIQPAYISLLSNEVEKSGAKSIYLINERDVSDELLSEIQKKLSENYWKKKCSPLVNCNFYK